MNRILETILSKLKNYFYLFFFYFTVGSKGQKRNKKVSKEIEMGEKKP